MKKRIFLLLLLFAMPALVLPVTEEGISIAGLSMDPVPFNERRDPAADSPYNAFDGDLKTSALYSDFTMEFSKPVTIDQIKILNGNASGKEKFKKDNRERDIEIILYTIAVKADKSAVKSSKKKKTAKPGTAESKKTPIDKDTKDKAEPDKIEKDKIEKEKKDNEIKKSSTPEKVVMKDEYETFSEYRPEGVKLYFTASETVIEPEKKSADDIKTEKTETKKPVVVKTDNKNPDKKSETAAKPVKPKNAEKKTSGKTPAKKETEKKPAAKPAKPPVVKKEKTTDKNIIEITDSKKSAEKTVTSAADDKKNSEPEKETITESPKKEMDETERKKALAADDKSVKAKTDNPPKKKSASENKKSASKKSEKKPDKKNTAKTPVKSPESKTVKNNEIKKETAKKEPVKKETAKKEHGKTQIEIVDSKSKSEKKPVSAGKKTPETKQVVKPAAEKKESEKTAVKPVTEKKIEQKGEVKKEIKKEDKKQAIDIKPVEDVKVQKMTGIVRIENDAAGRVLVYASLKDSMDFQSIDLKGDYTVKKIDFRTRDDEYYAGDVPDRSGIGEISFFNNGKKITLQGIDSMKKSYIERYSKNLADSLSGETFIMYENGDIVLRMKFRKDGRMEFFDRYKCSKKGDADCTYLSMPDMWRVTGGKLMMRYHTLWRVWKYELDSQNDMLSDAGDTEPPRWMKLYYKSDTGFTDQYLELYRSEKGVWAE